MTVRLTPQMLPERMRRCPARRATVMTHAVLSVQNSRSVGSSLEDLSVNSKRIVHVERPQVSSLLARHSGCIKKACRHTFRDCEEVLTGEGLPASSALLRRLSACPDVHSQLQADVMEICKVLRREHGVKQAAVKLQAIQGTMCPRVHCDYVHLRAICSYLGPGTDYFPCEDVLMVGNRVLGARSKARQQTPTGDVLYLKGLFDRDGAPAAHCSPEYDGDRLLLVVETISDSPEFSNY